MPMTDPISDMLATIRNAQLAMLAQTSTPSSNVKKSILTVLKEEGYITGYEENEVRKGVSRITIDLKYFEGKPAIKELKRVSRPGRRNYRSVDSLPKVFNGLGMSIISTSKGVLPDYEAKKQKIGGEILFSIF
jgi:small subunit ribosomal protein S8